MIERGYVFFPLFMISGLFKGQEIKDEFGNMLEYGIWNYANTIKIESYTNVYRQVLYCYFIGGLPDDLTKYLLNQKENGNLSLAEDYKGFDQGGESFEPEDLDDLQHLGAHDDDFRAKAVQFYRVRQAFKHLNLTGRPSGTISIANILYERELRHIALYGKDPFVMLKRELLIEFRDDTKEMYDVVVFAAYAAIKSIIGSEKYGSATKDIIVSRLVGAKSKKVLLELLKNKKLKFIYDKYTKRYHFDKLMNEIEARNFLRSKLAIKKGGKSRLYFSTVLDHKMLAELLAKQANKQNNTQKKKLEIEARAYYKLLTSA